MIFAHIAYSCLMFKLKSRLTDLCLFLWIRNGDQYWTSLKIRAVSEFSKFKIYL